ncbi:MAG: hypothetical protein JW866_09070 [Ignavibacteriales bacterium]|nr:hypothetical protein [Ignavibacteriales bacterium]
MKYIIDVPDGIHKKITKMIADGDYATMQDFALTALQNQFLIEDSSKESDQHMEKHGIVYSLKVNTKEKRWELPENKTEINFKTLINSTKSNDWLFGQVNRILPIKFGLRNLISYQEECGGEIDLDWFLEKAADQARKFGKILEDQDNNNNVRRDERVSVGFPLGKEEKSLSRYKSHFLGYMQSTTGQSVGALPELGFAVINQDNNNETKIGITDGGLKFGLLKNPVLDGFYNKVTITKEESLFYIQHILKQAPGEVKALGIIVGMISNNINRPKQMNIEILKLFPKWTTALCVTNRSGAIGRATDLGLVNRNRDGIEVFYELSDLGNEVVEIFTKEKVIEGDIK